MKKRLVATAVLVGVSAVVIGAQAITPAPAPIKVLPRPTGAPPPPSPFLRLSPLPPPAPLPALTLFNAIAAVHAQTGAAPPAPPPAGSPTPQPFAVVSPAQLTIPNVTTSFGPSTFVEASPGVSYAGFSAGPDQASSAAWYSQVQMILYPGALPPVGSYVTVDCTVDTTGPNTGHIYILAPGATQEEQLPAPAPGPPGHIIWAFAVIAPYGVYPGDFISFRYGAPPGQYSESMDWYGCSFYN